MGRNDWIVYLQYALIWFIAMAFVAVLSGCVEKPAKYRKYRLSNGKLVECGSTQWQGGGMELSNCVGGSRYYYQHNVEEVAE